MCYTFHIYNASFNPHNNSDSIQYFNHHNFADKVTNAQNSEVTHLRTLKLYMYSRKFKKNLFPRF